MLDTAAQWQACYKPWDAFNNRSRTRSQSQGRGGGVSGGGAGGKPEKTRRPDSPKPKRTPFAANANYHFFCKKHLECPGREPPAGDGTCKKVHTEATQAAHHVNKWKKQLNDAAEGEATTPKKAPPKKKGKGEE